MQWLIELHNIQRSLCPRNIVVMLLYRPISRLGNILASLSLLTVPLPLSLLSESNIWTYIRGVMVRISSNVMI